MTRGKIVRVPNQPATPKRSIRVPDEMWLTARANAAERGEDLASIVRDAIDKYNKRCARERKKKAGQK